MVKCKSLPINGNFQGHIEGAIIEKRKTKREYLKLQVLEKLFGELNLVYAPKFMIFELFN